MKSTSWPYATARRNRLLVLLASAILAVAAVGCTKEAESRSFDPTAAPAQTEAASAAGKAAAPAGAVAPGAAAVRGVAAEAQPSGTQTASDDTYTVKVEAPSTLASGAEGTARVTVTPQNGWKMNKEFPTKLKVAAPAGVTVTKAEQSVADAERFEEAGATFAVKFQAADAGEKAFQAKFRFAVCTDATCTPKSQELAWVVNVE